MAVVLPVLTQFRWWFLCEVCHLVVARNYELWDRILDIKWLTVLATGKERGFPVDTFDISAGVWFVLFISNLMFCSLSPAKTAG